MSSISPDNAKQYGDSRKLAARARLNQEYTIAETGIRLTPRAPDSKAMSADLATVRHRQP
jgi:hypothetical protein